MIGKVAMPLRVRVVTPPDGLGELTHRLGREGLSLPEDAIIEVCRLDEEQSVERHWPADIDLLYVPRDRMLVQPLGLAFAAMVDAPRAGVLTCRDGVVLHRGRPDQLGVFFGARGPQADSRVYEHGAAIRREYTTNGGVPAPRQIYLGLTQKCDRSCDFCVSRTFDFDILSCEEVERIVQELDGDLDVVALTGAGEAMMHPDFWTILDRLHDGFPRATFKMNTSGLSLLRSSERLLEYRIKNITVSLNAATDETYRLHVGPGYKAVLRGLERLVRARTDRRALDVRLCLSMVLMRSTLPELARMVRLAFELGVEEVQGIYLMIHDGALAHDSPWHDQETSNNFLTEAEELAERLGVIASLPPKFGANASIGERQVASLPTRQGHLCSEVFSTAYIRPDGGLTPCPYYDDVLGNSRVDDGLLGVWNGPRYSQLRRAIVTGTAPLPCQTCAGFSEGGRVDDYASHWLGTRVNANPVPVVLSTRR